jgi:protein associated with RNAse G/E
MAKYRGVKTNVDGIKFASKLEAMYYNHLKKLREEGIIKSFALQVPFVLQEPFDKKGVHYRGIKYICDFDVIYADGRREIIDTKAWKTDVFKLKEKLFHYKYPELDLILVRYIPKLGGFITWDEYNQFKKQQKKDEGRRLKTKAQRKKNKKRR